MPRGDDSCKLVAIPGFSEATTVSINSLREDLARLENDVQTAFNNPDQPSLQERAKAVGAGIVAAQYVATKETMSSVGGMFEALSEIGAIQNEQFRIFFTDHRDTLKALIQVRSPVDLLQLGFEHWNRRASHVAEAITRTVDVISKERNELSTSMTEIWKPIVGLVRSDWTRR